MRALSRSSLAAIVALAASALSVPAQAQQMTKDQLVRTWKLVSFKATTGDQVSYPQGEHPGGYIGFTPDRFWSLLVDSTRKAPAAAAMSDAEAASLMRSHSAYTGKYDADPAQTPDGIKIVVHVDAAANPAITGTDRVIYVRVDGKKLTVKSPAIVVSTTGLKSVVQLELVRTD